MINPKQTFLFYDIETSGLNKCFDQVLQFAAIRTDLQLNEIERHEIFVKLSPDVIPSPYALITHRMGIKAMLSGENEYEATIKIHSLLNQPGTISIGYNSLGFDDEFLRFSFYRHLLTPYTHQFKNACVRMDLYPITLLFFLYENKILNWPVENGKSNLKLENLIHLNQLTLGKAHNAMADVEATLALARIFFSNQKMWHYALNNFNKQHEQKRIQQLPIAFASEGNPFREAILLHGRLGAESRYQAPVLFLGQHYHYKNQTIWLRLDNPNLAQTTENSVAEKTVVIRKKNAEQEILLPPHQRFLYHIDSARLEIAEQNKEWLQKNSNLFKKICDYHLNYKYPVIENRDIASALYDIGFLQQDEIVLFEQFHLAPADKKISIAKQITHPIYHELAMRLISKHFTAYATEESQQIFQPYITNNFAEKGFIIDFRGESKLTAHQALGQISEMRQQNSLDNEQLILLKEYEAYLKTALSCFYGSSDQDVIPAKARI